MASESERWSDPDGPHAAKSSGAWSAASIVIAVVAQGVLPGLPRAEGTLITFALLIGIACGLALQGARTDSWPGALLAAVAIVMSFGPVVVLLIQWLVWGLD